MGRRKQEPRSVHRAKIASVASSLFLESGISATSMDDIARKAGYSKATLYVYFQNKDEIVSVLVLDSMKKLCDYISSALRQQQSTRDKYDLICRELVRYQEEYPFYFKITLETINIDFDNRDYFPEDKETFQVGEEINEMIRSLLLSGIEKGDLRRDIEIAPTAFSCWGMMAGLIQFAENKKDYVQQAMGLSKNEFLQYGFDMIYQSISSREGRQ